MVIIRNMTEADAAQVLEMMRIFYASPAVLTNGSEEIFATDVENCVGGCPYLEGYVFEDGPAIQGYAMLAKSFSTEYGKPCIWIEDIYIRPEGRGAGIGTAFFAELERRYPNALLKLEVERENAGAVRMYQRCGFEILPYTEMKKMNPPARKE